MAFFDDLGKKISQTSQGVVQKTKDTAEVIKLNSWISDQEKRINAIYTQIGKIYFDLHNDSYEEPFESMILSIKEAQSKIGEYSEQVKRLKGIVKCPNCSSDVQYGSPFCSSCGTKLETRSETTTTEDKNVVRCSKCGAPINDGCAFCTNCGTKVENSIFQNELGAVIKDEGGEVVIDEKPVDKTSKICPYCNNPLSLETVFCTNCGKKLEEEIELNNSSELESVVQSKPNICPTCKTEFETDALFCMNCGSKLKDL